MTEEKRKQAEGALFTELRKEQYLDEKDGVFNYTVYPSYDDRFSDKKVEEILLSEDPEMAFAEAVEETYCDYYHGTYEGEIIDRAVRKSYPANEDEEEEIRDYLRDYITEILTYEYPYDHYDHQAYKVDLMVDTGDGNYDYTLNSLIYPHYHDMQGAEIEDRASLVWLAATQGYTRRQLQHALDKGDVEPDEVKDFMTSVRQEVANETSGMNCLTFLVEMTMKDLISLYKLIRLQEPAGEQIYDARFRPDCGTVKVIREATAGLFDPWNGAGSCFEIQLEKDIELPVKYIRSCLPDRHFRWSVSSVYAMCDSAWKEDIVTDITAPLPAA